MCWSKAPSFAAVNGVSQDVPVEPLISRELLRAVCEPFFEQMLTAVQESLLQAQKQQKNEEAQAMKPATQMMKPTSFQPVVRPVSRIFGQLDPMLDEESTEADEPGAFASLLSGPSSEGESVDAVEAKSPESEVPLPMSPTSLECIEQTCDPEKSTMVCRHWKSKGWCRLQSNCKFLHPEHKRGISAPKGCGGSKNNGDISRVAHPGISTILSLSDAISTEVDVPKTSVAQRMKRGGRIGSSTNSLQQAQLGDPEQEVASPDSLGYLAEHHTFHYV